MLRKGNERKKWEMEMEHTVPVTRSSIIYFLKIKKNKYIYIYIYIYEIYTNSNYNRYKKSFLILQKCHRINFYTGLFIIDIKDFILFTKLLSASYFIPDGFEQV